MNGKSPEEVLNEWRGSAPYWEKHGRIVREMFEPITRAMIEAAEFGDGMTVLDVAGGTGEPSLAIAREVGARGMAVCTDGALEMVAAAKRQAGQSGAEGIAFAQTVADALPFRDGIFDVTLSRLGAMFFMDIEASLREMRRVTKPGGNLLLAVWGGRELNPFFAVVTDVLARYVESPPEDPDAPGAFRFSEPGKLAAIVKDSGWRDVKERALDFYIEAPLDAKEFWAVRSEISDTLRKKVAGLSPEQRASVAGEVEHAARDFFPGGRMKFPARVIIVRARRTE